MDNRELYEGDGYYFTYKKCEDWVYLIDVFVVEEKRNRGITDMIWKKVQDIANENEFSYVTSSISKLSSDKTRERSYYLLTKNGFEKYEEDIYMEYYRKGLK